MRAALAEALRQGLVVPEGLIAFGRGEAFDYLLGERTTPSARRAERAAADWIRAARRPVLSVNGNVAALASREVARLARAAPKLGVEVNLFHRSPFRARAVAERLRSAGVPEVLGVRPTARIRGLDSDRARVDRRGIYVADLCLIPLEDGDRAEALRARGQRVVSIDLNPLSRTSRVAQVPIVDELTRALGHVADDLERAGGRPTAFAPFDADGARTAALEAIYRNLTRGAGTAPRRRPRRPDAPPPPRGTARRSRRRP